MSDVMTFLPDRVWYLTQSGKDMWCRRPYGFFFTTADAARSFALQMSELPLEPIGIAAKELISEEGLASMRRLEITRVFVDPVLDAQTGEVHGPILRIESPQGLQ
jgi:hypothetical protein